MQEDLQLVLVVQVLEVMPIDRWLTWYQYDLWSSGMANYRDIYKVAFLSAKVLGKRKIKSKIVACYVETVGKGKDNTGDKLVIEVEEGDTRIALNKGNAVALGKKYGDDYNDWVGRTITIQTQSTTYMGEPTLGLQVVPL